MARAVGSTERVRQELARDLPTEPCDRRALLAALLAFGGSLHLRGAGALRIELRTSSGAVARLVFTLLTERLGDQRPELAVHAPGGIRSGSTYVVAVEDGGRRVASEAGLVDEDGRPTRRPPTDTLHRRCDRLAFVRGAFLAAGSISAPGREPHLEIAAPNGPLAALTADAVAGIIGQRPHVGPVGHSEDGRWRAVLKSGEAIGDLLTALGATGAFLEWDDARLRRSLRGEANRLANADAANLRRSVEAAAAQVRAVEQAVRAVGWDELSDDLRQVALARLANPEATMAELGELCDPPIGKSAVHRRLRRLEELAAGD